jgi:hypothetical protein
MMKVLEEVGIVKLFLALYANRSVWFHDRCWFSCELDLSTDTVVRYIGVLISLWLFLFPTFLFAAQPKEFFLDGLKKSEQ